MSTFSQPVLSVLECGSGSQSLVLLHGYCEGNWVWEQMLSHLPEDIHCICIELPGFGGSVSISGLEEAGADGMGMVADVVWAELDKRDLRDVWLAGHSLGGYVMLAMLESAPERVNGMVLFHSSPLADSPERKLVRDKVIRLVKENGTAPFLNTFADGLFREKGAAWEFFRQHSKETTPDAITSYAAIMRDRVDRSVLLRDSGKRLLIIAGRFDAIIPEEVSVSISRLAPDFIFVMLEKSAHTGMLEEPEASARLVAAFIAPV